MRKTLLSLWLVLATLPCAIAQDFRATLTGIVTDSSSAAIPGATVKAINISTNTAKEVQTTSIGNYTIPYLDPGTYKIEVTAQGFQTLVRDGIILRVADKVNLPMELKVGQTMESITVTGDQQVIETASADRG